MSVDITFQKRLNLKEIQEKTDISVEEHENKKYLTYNGSTLHINNLDENDEFDSITQYGLNRLGDIMNIIVPKFQTKFITDNEWEMIFHEQKKGNEVDIDKIFDETTKEYGHNINESGVILS